MQSRSSFDDGDDLLHTLDSLSVKDGLDSILVAYSAWKTPPEHRFVSPDLSVQEIVDIITGALAIDVDPCDVSQLVPKRSLPSSFQIRTFCDPLAPESKPNLLIIIATLFKKYRDAHPKCSEAELIASLGKSYDIIAPRNPIKKISSISKGEAWEVYASKPLIDGPLFIDRTASYSQDIGSIGNQFETKVSTKSEKYDRVYAVQSSHLNRLRIVLTGEIDCIDPVEGGAVEIKSRPGWAPLDQVRLLDTYIQSKFAGVKTIVTGNFISQRGVRNGPVTFLSRNIQYQTIKEYARQVDGAENCFDYTEKVMRKAMQECKEVGVIYKITGCRSGAIAVSKCNAPFAISSSVISNCAKATLA